MPVGDLIYIYVNLDYSLSFLYSAGYVRRAWYIRKLEKSMRQLFCDSDEFHAYAIIRQILIF